MNKHLNKMFSVVTILAVMLVGLPLGSATAAPSLFANLTTTVFINEIHYDNGGTDAGEAIEIAGPAGTDLTGWSIVLYNGANGLVYDTDALSGIIVDQQGGYGTVVVNYPVNGIQNGSPDGIALVDASSTLVQFLSYEGAFTGVGGAADGVTSTDIGVSETGSGAVGNSLQLTGSGTAYGDFTWAAEQANTFDGPNTGQIFGVGDTGPTELFFSEYIEGSSNNKALEIYNGTGASVDLAAGGYVIQFFFNGSTSAGTTIGLTGTVADGDVYVVADNDSVASILNGTDQTSTSNFFNGDDAIILWKGGVGGTIVDSFGQRGVDPGSQWVGGGADDTLRRAESVCAGDTNPDDAFDASVEWVVFAQDTFDGLGAHTVNCDDSDVAPSVSSTFPVEGATDFATGANLEVTFTEPVDVTTSSFDLTCSVSGTVATTPSGGPTTFTLDPDVSLANGENCTLTVFADQVSDQDTNDPPDNMELDFTVGFSALDYCAADHTPIYDIQGSGPSAATTGTVLTRGVVVGDFEGPIASGIQGFYLQDATGDGDVTTSDGIFVFTGDADNNLNAGDVVAVSGFARERFNQTAIQGSNNNSAAVPGTNIVVCGTGSVEPVDVEMPFDSPTYLERFEGMLVRFPQALVISEYFNYDRFGEIVLGLPLEGQTRHFTPTGVVEPGPDAQALAAEYSLRRITLDDGLGIQNPDFTRHPNGDAFTLDNRFRGGDTVANTVGVLGFDFSLYRIQPTAPADYTAVNLRPEQPDEVGGNVKVASFNVLNYFLTIDNGPDICGPLQNQDCRGADSVEEFERQRAKIMSALGAIQADVFGLIEMENTTGVEPLADIVAGLNDELGAGTYAFIDTGTIGTDAIKVGIIYKPATVTPLGAYAILDSSVDARFDDARSRPVLAQTFWNNETGGVFTVAVNHLKSKGSACGLGDDDPVQGNCNLTRTLAAEALVDWLASDPTGSGDEDFLITGDLNAYDKEDPIDQVREGADDTFGTGDDYTDLLYHFIGEFAYSYVFDGQAGYLDHGLAIQDLLDEVTGATVWHINADEPDLIDYDTSFKSDAQDDIYAPDAYRSSDHDPVIIGLELTTEAEINELIEAVQGLVDEGLLNGGQGNSLISKLEHALARLAHGNTNAAANQLGAFINEIEDFVSEGILTAEQAEPLLKSAMVLVEALSN